MAAGFAVLILLTVKAYQNAPPIPDKFVDPAGAVVFTADDVIAGQQVFFAAAFHHDDNDSIGPVSASAIVPSRRRYIHLRNRSIRLARWSSCILEPPSSRRDNLAAPYDRHGVSDCAFRGPWGASHFEIVIGIPTFSIRPIVVWNKMLRIRKVVRSHTVSFTE
jgi:hypothetical protein